MGSAQGTLGKQPIHHLVGIDALMNKDIKHALSSPVHLIIINLLMMKLKAIYY